MFVNDTNLLARIIEKIAPKKPESFECYDDRALQLVLRFLGDFLRILRISNIVSLAWRFLPEFTMFLFGGFPKLVLLAEFTFAYTTLVVSPPRRVPGPPAGISSRTWWRPGPCLAAHLAHAPPPRARARLDPNASDDPSGFRAQGAG